MKVSLNIFNSIRKKYMPEKDPLQYTKKSHTGVIGRLVRQKKKNQAVAKQEIFV